MESFALAVKQGADGIESDVRRSADGRLFLFHDGFVAYGGRPVRPEHLDLRTLQAIDLGDGRRIPALEEVLSAHRDTETSDGHPLYFSLDVIPLSLGAAVAELAARYGMASRVVITPPDTDPAFNRAVAAIRSADKDVVIVRTTRRSARARLVRALPGRPTGMNWPWMRAAGICGLNIRARYARPAVMNRVRRNGFRLFVWDCQDRATLTTYAGAGVDGIYTDYPDRLHAILAGSGGDGS